MAKALGIDHAAASHDWRISGPRPGTGLGWKSRVFAAGWALGALLLLSGAGPARADSEAAPRAVESLNFTGLAELQVTREDRPLDFDTGTGREALIGGWLTAPLGERFGVRLALDGGIEAVSSDGIVGHISRSLLNAGGDLFMRDPSKGYVQLGYRWSGAWWSGRDDFQLANFMESDHRVRGSAGLFRGDFDLEFGIEYLRLSGEVTVTTLSTGNEESFSSFNNGFRLLGGSTWYAADALALGFDVEWGRTEHGFDPFHQDRFQARFGADWQPPVASPGVGATVGLSVGLGYYTVPVVTSTIIPTPGPGFDTETTVNDVYSFSYDIRLGVTVYFPGTSSLKERARRYQ